MPLVIGTRGSALALVQADRACALLREAGIGTEKTIITTEGDTITNFPLHEIGGQGIFVRALDDAILSGKIDAAVHSMKDIPAARPAGVVTAAVLPRDSPADFLAHLVPEGDIRVIGTSSTRRKAQLLRHFPGLTVKNLRGNVDTRLRKLSEGRYDAIVLAEAGIGRLSLDVPGRRLPPETFVPAPNQGIIAVVCRDDPDIRAAVARLDDPETRVDAAIERAVMEELGGGCYTPIGIYSVGGHLTAEVLSLDGKRQVRHEEGIRDPDSARSAGRRLRAEAGELIREAWERLGVKG
ncbi:MAG: hydroxymethylbilane synthase [Methanoregulaceae archaeon]|nr:hydroxymethylbilane synthase [Methanoregulaceae archaeon]